MTWLRHGGIPVPIFVYLLHSYLGPFTRDHGLCLAETLLRHVPKELFISVAGKGRTHKATVFYEFFWEKRSCPALQAVLTRLTQKMYDRLGEAFCHPSKLVAPSSVTSPSGDGGNDASQDEFDEIPAFSLPAQWLDRFNHSPQTPLGEEQVGNSGDSAAGEEEEEEEFNPLGGLPDDHLEDSFDFENYDSEDEDRPAALDVDDDIQPATRTPPTYTRTYLHMHLPHTHTHTHTHTHLHTTDMYRWADVDLWHGTLLQAQLPHPPDLHADKVIL